MVIIIHISPIESPNVPGYLHGLGIVHRDLGGWNHTCPALRDRFSVGYPNSTCSLSWELYGKNMRHGNIEICENHGLAIELFGDFAQPC